MRFILPLITALLLLHSINVYSQNEKSPYHSAWYSADNDMLPQNSVKSIIKDKYGYIWLATEAGLVSYDGRHFNVYNNQNVKGLTYNRMYLFQGSALKDSIYLWNNSLSYILISNHKVSVIPQNKIPKKYRKYNYTEKVPKRMLKFHVGDGYYDIDDNYIKYIDLNNKIQWQIFYKNTWQLSFFLSKEKLYAIDVEGKSLSFNSGYTSDIIISGRANNDKTLIANDVAQQTFFYIKKSLYMLQDNNGSLALMPVLKDYDLTKSNITCAYLDTKTDNLYLGSENNGLLVIKKKQFKALLGPDKSGYYYSQLPYSDSTVMTSSGEIFSTAKVEKKYDFRDKTDTFVMVRDINGNIWLKLSTLLYCFKKETDFNTFTKWEFSNGITQIFENKDGKIFVGLSINGKRAGKLYVMNPKDKTQKFISFMPLNFGPTYTVQNEDNVLWIGSETGLFKLHISGKKVEVIKAFSGKYIRSLKFEGQDKIWVTTYDSGFYLYDIALHKATAFPLDLQKNLLSSHYIAEDKNGYLWIPTNKGLYQCSKDNLMRFAAGKTKNVYYQHYDMTDGFLTNEFNGGCQPGGLYLKNGFFSFPSMKGIVFFNPNNIVPNLPDSPINFVKAEIDGLQTEFKHDTLLLNQNFGRLNLYLSSPYYGNAANLNIYVKIAGPVFQNWRPYDQDGITLSTLPPGTYRVYARKLSGFNAKYIYKSLVIIVPEAYWQTTYFKVAIGILLLSLCAYTIKIRTRYIARKNILLQEKISEQTYQLRKTITTLRKTSTKLKNEIGNQKKLIATITHDIKSPLRFLALTGKHVYQNMAVANENDPETEAMQENIKSIYTSSSQLYNFVDNLLEYAKISDEETSSAPYSLYKLVEEKIKIFLAIADSKRIKIDNDIDEQLMTGANRLLIAIIIHNLLDNSIKNTLNGKITFTAQKDNKNTTLVVKDTGRGMDAVAIQFYLDKSAKKKKEKGRTGTGLKMIGDLIVMLEGSINIVSQVGEGTAVTITFPNRNI